MSRRVLLMLTVFCICWVVRQLFVQGLFLPVRVASGSMAYPLIGPHLVLTCPDCRIEFECVAESIPDERFVCPNCGLSFTGESAVIRNQLGVRVLIDKLSGWHSPKRWEVVAFFPESSEKKLAVKRIVGLPGETVSIVNGSIVANGKQARKSFPIQQQMAILVHDDRFRSTDSAKQSRWVTGEGSGWSRTDQGYQFTASKNDGNDPPSIRYRHVACLPMPSPPDTATIVQDSYGCNQAISRSLHGVDDLMLTHRLYWQDGDAGSVAWEIDSFGDRLQVDWYAKTRQLRLLHDGLLIAASPLRIADGSAVAISTFDRLLTFAVNGKTQFRHRLPTATADSSLDDDDGANRDPAPLTNCYPCRGIRVPATERVASMARRTLLADASNRNSTWLKRVFTAGRQLPNLAGCSTE